MNRPVSFSGGLTARAAGKAACTCCAVMPHVAADHPVASGFAWAEATAATAVKRSRGFIR